jgi:hypothetical protein
VHQHLLRTEVSILIDWYTRNRMHKPINISSCLDIWEVLSCESSAINIQENNLHTLSTLWAVPLSYTVASVSPDCPYIVLSELCVSVRCNLKSSKMLQCGTVVIITEQCLVVLHVCITVFTWNGQKHNYRHYLLGSEIIILVKCKTTWIPNLNLSKPEMYLNI